MTRRWLCGLGNPDAKYEKTRHNAGFMALDAFASTKGATAWSKKHESQFLKIREGEIEHILIKPLTYMNDSGRSLGQWRAKEGLDPAALLLIFDDMDLPLGKLRYRASGSAGSHNGMASVIEHLGGESLQRLRLGIGRPDDAAEWADYVLRPFNAEEGGTLKETLERAAKAMEAWSRGESDERLMSQFNS